MRGEYEQVREDQCISWLVRTEKEIEGAAHVYTKLCQFDRVEAVTKADMTCAYAGRWLAKTMQSANETSGTICTLFTFIA